MIENTFILLAVFLPVMLFVTVFSVLFNILILCKSDLVSENIARLKQQVKHLSKKVSILKAKTAPAVDAKLEAVVTKPQALVTEPQAVVTPTVGTEPQAVVTPAVDAKLEAVVTEPQAVVTPTVGTEPQAVVASADANPQAVVAAPRRIRPALPKDLLSAINGIPEQPTQNLASVPTADNPEDQLNKTVAYCPLFAQVSKIASMHADTATSASEEDDSAWAAVPDEEDTATPSTPPTDANPQAVVASADANPQAVVASAPTVVAEPQATLPTPPAERKAVDLTPFYATPSEAFKAQNKGVFAEITNKRHQLRAVNAVTRSAPDSHPFAQQLAARRRGLTGDI